MFENILKFFKKAKKEDKKNTDSKNTAKERLHLVLMQDRANVSADFLDLMRQEIIDVIKKYIEIDESAIDVRLTNKENEDGTNGAPALYANIPIINIKNEVRKIDSQKAQDKKPKETTDNEEEQVKQEDIQIKKQEETENTEQKQEEIKNKEKTETKENKEEESTTENK